MSESNDFASELNDFFQTYLDNAWRKFRRMDTVEQEQFDGFVVWLQKVTQNDADDFNIIYETEEDESDESSDSD